NPATGVLSGTPTNANVGSHVVVLRATDTDGLTAEQSFTIVVANVNDAPTIISSAQTSATQDAAYSYTLVATDS
ncbi:putative Ig domain-containing protein, partial [Shewanella sp. POL2]